MNSQIENYKFKADLDFAQEQDSIDPLKEYRSKYHIVKSKSGNEQIYFCGNSLGLQPKSTAKRIQVLMSAWAERGVEAWFDEPNPWINSHHNAKRILSNIVGASPKEIAVANSLSVNLHLLLISFYRPTNDRYKIIIEADAFPSDQYIVKSQLELHGYSPNSGLITIEPSIKGMPITPSDIEQCLKEHGYETCVVLIGGVNYSTGQAFDIGMIKELCNRHGCMLGVDLAHAIGNIPLNLQSDEVDFAAWCHYKYLNAGPGSIGGMFVHQKHHHADLPRLHGWWGNRSDTKFLMQDSFEGEVGAESWVMSTPSQLNIAALNASLQLFEEAGMNALRTKSIKLTGYLEYVIGQIESHDIEIITPNNPKERGCQLSLKMNNNGRAVFDALIENNVIVDWREPNIIRLSPCPMYNTYQEVYQTGQLLSSILNKIKKAQNW